MRLNLFLRGLRLRLLARDVPAVSADRLRVAIFSIEGDLHALAVKYALEHDHGVDCSVIETDRLPDSPGLTWSLDQADGAVRSADGRFVEIGSLDAIWWRRINRNPRIPARVTDPSHVQLISNDVGAALLGTVLGDFRGAWVSEPFATQRAENKLVQLRTARDVGFTVPATLVSQNPARIREFCSRLGNKVVVKTVRGTYTNAPLTRLLDTRLLDADETMRLCPTIYQEFVPGDSHIRAHVFGDTVIAALIRSPEVDWRPDPDVPVEPVELSDNVNQRLRAVVNALHLRMGIVDLKLTSDGEPTWLELNAQGQFLFIEGLGGLPLTADFSRFLVSEAARGRRHRMRHAAEIA